MSPLLKALDFVKARREAGLSDETMHILLLLSQQRQGLSREWIAAEAGINPTTLPRYLSGLVASGHLQKRQGGRDGRGRIFLLTGHGLRLAASLLKHFPAGDE